MILSLLSYNHMCSCLPALQVTCMNTFIIKDGFLSHASHCFAFALKLRIPWTSCIIQTKLLYLGHSVCLTVLPKEQPVFVKAPPAMEKIALFSCVSITFDNKQ